MSRTALQWCIIVFIAIAPILTIFIAGRLLPFQKSDDSFVDPIIQPPKWMFSVVWTYLTLALGIVLAVFLYQTNKNSMAQLGPLILYGLILITWVCWMALYPVSRRLGFVCLLTSLAVSVAFLMMLSTSGKLYVYAFFPVCLWLAYAASLNAVMIENESRSL